jgi:hypothetical protein
MMLLKLSIFAVGIALSGLVGYFPWRYATELGYFFKSLSIFIWVGALIVFGYLCYKQVVLMRNKVRDNHGQRVLPIHTEG